MTAHVSAALASGSGRIFVAYGRILASCHSIAILAKNGSKLIRLVTNILHLGGRGADILLPTSGIRKKLCVSNTKIH